jgi:hypothetical protein
MKKNKRTDTSGAIQKPKIHPDLEGFDITINPFGEIGENMDIDRINRFLDKNLEDKKLGNIVKKNQKRKNRN